MTMKRIDDLEQKELVSLTEAQIQRLIDIEIAHAGIMPVDCPIPPSLKNAGIVKTEIAYRIGDMYFANRADAETVARMNCLKSEYDWNISYNYKWLTPTIDPVITEESFYRQEDVVRVKGILADIESKKKDYEPQKTAYDKYLKATGDIRNQVWAKVHAAQALQREIELAQRTYQKHLDLAEQDETVAQNFFREAYKDREDLIEAVIGKREAVVA